MRKKDNNQTIKNKTSGTTKPPANKSGLMRQLADQLATVFIVALLCLWLAAKRSEVSEPAIRMTWWYCVIFSVFALFLWLFLERKRIRSPKLWWVSLIVVIVFIWSLYGISGISFQSGFFIGLAIFLLIWVAVLFVALALIMTKWGMEGKLGKIITWVIREGGHAYWQLAVLVAFTSIFMGWKMLWDTGMRCWWMTPLLGLGLLVFFVVALIYSWTSNSGDKQ